MYFIHWLHFNTFAFSSFSEMCLPENTFQRDPTSSTAYLLSLNNNLNYVDAKAFCEAQGKELLWLEDQEESDWIAQLLLHQDPSVESWWLG